MLKYYTNVQVQLTLEQHEFELQESTYTQIFFSIINTTVVQDPISSMGCGTARQKANYNLYWDFSLLKGAALLTLTLFKSQL